MAKRAKTKSKPAAVKTEPPVVVVEPVETSHETSLPEKPQRILKLVFGLVGGLMIVALLLVIGYFGYEYKYTNLIYPGVAIAAQPVSGLNYTDAAQLVQNYKTTLANTGLQFHYDELDLTIPTTSDDVPLVDIQIDKTVQAAFAIGRSDNATTNATGKLNALLTGTNLPLVYDLASESISDQLAATFDSATEPYVDAKLVVDGDDVTVQPHQDGQIFVWDDVMTAVEANLAQLAAVDIELALTSVAAPITTTEAEAIVAEAETVLALAPLTLTYGDKSYDITVDELGSWLVASDHAGTTELALDEETVRASLATIAGEIDIPVKEGKFSLDVVDDVVQLTQFEQGQDGLGVAVDKTMAALTTALLQDHSSTVELVVEVTTPHATPTNLEDLGIKELLGTGETNFAGSPYNRILNIHKGADMLNGLLIAPGETFSLLDILNPIDTSHGWYSELVIKGDKLEKEAGGGLCQVGTTSFRAAMLSGLPIVERRNHSWAISYYAYNGKAGVDATIYDPSPDFKFLNDTGHYILWRSRIEGSSIYFELWGTSDGRKGYFTEPTNYGYVSAGPTIETVDESAAPGSRVCDGHAFTGVSASFDYIVEQPDGTTDTETFTSVYKARPQLCVVGPDGITEDAEETTEDSEAEEVVEETPEDTNANSNTNTNTNSGKKKKKE
ncbi:MAG: VanW family protein [Candidatus Kerfeldbacteria bacterium]|nr:VanW family protein [Candidatus Kerfeldbacteria bacterium]